MYGSKWTKNGQYNWVKYTTGDKIEALPGRSTAQIESYIVWWYPGKPALGCIDDSVEDSQVKLEQLPLKGNVIITQEPIPNGAWWVGKNGSKLVGPYDWDTARRIAWALCEASA